MPPSSSRRRVIADVRPRRAEGCERLGGGGRGPGGRRVRARAHAEHRRIVLPTRPAYCGYWRHWFADRRQTIVYYYVEEGRAYEVARSLEQLAWYEALKLYDND